MFSYFMGEQSNQTTTGRGKSNRSSSCTPTGSTDNSDPSLNLQSNLVSSHHDSKFNVDAHLEVQQEYRSEHRHDRNVKTKRTPESRTSDAAEAETTNHHQRLPRHDRDNSDSTASSTEDSHGNRLTLMMTSLPHPKNSREKQRRRTRSSSRRTHVNINSALSQPLLMDVYGETHNSDEVHGLRAARRRSSKALLGSVPLSSERRSYVDDNKTPISNYDKYSLEKSHNSEYSSGFTSESSHDSSPRRLVSERQGLRQYQHYDTPIHAQRRSSPRLSMPSRNTLSWSGNDSTGDSTKPYNPSKSPITKSTSSSTLKSTKAKAVTSNKFFSLASLFVGVVILSLFRMILMTKEAVPTTLRQEQFIVNLVNLPDDNGLRGKQVLGRMWDTSATNSEDFSSSQDSSRSKQIIQKDVSGSENSPSEIGAFPSGSQSETKKIPKGEVIMLPFRLQMHLPPPGVVKAEPDFHIVDRNLHNPSSTFRNDIEADVPPRIVMFDPFVTRVSRKIKKYPTDFTDNTQLYGILPSDDEKLKRMEIREPYNKNECVPMQEWQTMYQPSCNGMHELALQTLGASTGTDEKKSLKMWNRGNVEGLNATLFGTKGFWRYAWKLVIGYRDHAKAEEDTIVFKNLKYEHNFEDAHFEHDRIDAVAMERLTSSPHVINIFGFCGHSVMTEYADGKRLGELADKSKKTPLKRLEIARDIATGLADVHGIDGDGNTTFVHLDINPANVVSVKKTLKLNDFNVGIIRQWNTTSNKACGFPAQYPNPQWRSPEEARNEQHLTEKVDVFSLGHIFFRLICGHEPWNKLEPGGKPTKNAINAKVQRGELPFIPDHVLNSDDPEIIVIRDIMLKCYSLDPADRPSARYISNTFDCTLNDLKLKYAIKLPKSKKKQRSAK